MSIIYIANQCPLAGGNAVFAARSILSKYYPDAEYDDETLCAQAGVLLREFLESENTKSLISYKPNPANENFIVSNARGHLDGHLDILNSIGILKASYDFKNLESFIIESSGWGQGVYLCRFTDIIGTTTTEKLIVIH